MQGCVKILLHVLFLRWFLSKDTYFLMDVWDWLYVGWGWMAQQDEDWRWRSHNLSTMFRRHVSGFIAEQTNRSRYYLTGKVIHPRHQPCLFLHTQTVLWKKTDNEDVQSCQLLDFRPSDSSKTRKPLQALTVNDTTSGKVAFRHLRDGRALVYTGGDYLGLSQCTVDSGSQKKMF